ncbi:hypothetical protein [Streptomyces sp. NPDC058620]|uniref:hypothetical protein n=1 Tax=Streptomyces sp. NPDC058620 TaxID=3346560 RepID=UPI003662740F
MTTTARRPDRRTRRGPPARSAHRGRCREPARALRVADRPAADSDVLAVVGPTTDITAEAVVDRYEKARLAVVVVSPVASTAGLLTGTKTLCVISPFDETLTVGLIHYLVNVRPADRIHVIEDRTDRRGSWAVTNRIRDAAPVAGASVTVHGVEATADTFAPPARPRRGRGPRGRRRLRRGIAQPCRPLRHGADGRRFSPAPAWPPAPFLAPAFLEGAARAAEGWATRPLSFHPTRQVRPERGIFLYRIEEGRARFFGSYAKVQADRWTRGRAATQSSGPADGVKRSCGGA